MENICIFFSSSFLISFSRERGNNELLCKTSSPRIDCGNEQHFCRSHCQSIVFFCFEEKIIARARGLDQCREKQRQLALTINMLMNIIFIILYDDVFALSDAIDIHV